MVTKIINVLNDLIKSGAFLKNDPNISAGFDDYKQKLIEACNLIQNNIDDEIIKDKTESIRKLELKNLSLIDKFLFLKFRADYIPNWKKSGMYKYYIDEVNLKLMGILNKIKPEY